MQFFQALARFGLMRQSVEPAARYPTYSSDYIEQHLALFMTPPSPGTSSCPTACSFLTSALPGHVSSNSPYWSVQQEEVTPWCRVTPQTAEEVSLTLRVLKQLQCQFAVKSGGHAAFEGASNIEGGVTIDLVDLNEISVSDERNVTSLGPGNRWVDVYRKLDGMGLSVVGGRVADIGVGGLILGGGISFFSGRHGWACDNVVNYQVVLANGSICDVSLDTHPDLYFALRGGGNNFGIVTRFDVMTFQQGDVWGGGMFFSLNSSSAIIDALVDFNHNAPSDPSAVVLMAYAYSPNAYGGYGIGVEVVHTEAAPNAPILRNFTELPNIASSLQITNLTQMTVDMNASNPGGSRQTSLTLTIQNDAPLILKIVEIFKDEVEPIKNLSGIRPALLLQPITLDMISNFSRNGGNALGIAVKDGPLILLSVCVMWDVTDDDERIMKAARNVIQKANTTAHSLGLGHRFLYQNYAAAEQEVFLSYGADNYERLKAVSEKYDPRGIFTRLQPGYFKL